MVDGFDSTAFHALPKVMEKAVSHLPLPALRCSHKRVCEGAGIMTKTLLRSAIAAIVGIVVAFGLIWLAQYAGSEISPDVYDPNSGEILIPVGSTIALIVRSEEHTSELQSLMRISYAVFCLKKKKKDTQTN